METLWDILVQTSVILTFMAGVFGLVISFLLVVFPDRVAAWSRRFDYWISLDEKLRFLDSNLQSDRWIYRYPSAAGVLLIAGSTFFLIFLWFKLDVDRVLAIFFYRHELLPVIEVALRASVHLGSAAIVMGLLLGLGLLLKTETVMHIERKMAARLSTENWIDKLNTPHGLVDHIFLRYPVVLGLAGLGASVFLTFIGGIFLFDG